MGTRVQPIDGVDWNAEGARRMRLINLALSSPGLKKIDSAFFHGLLFNFSGEVVLSLRR